MPNGAHLRPLLLAAPLLVLDPRRAHACTLEGNFPLDIDPEEAAVDETPPTAPVDVRATEVEETRDSGCGGCGDFASFMIIVTAGTDDRTPAEQLGYLVEVVDGSMPFEVGDSPRVGPALHFYSGDLDAPPFSATLSVSPVDRAGNVGPAATVEVRGGGVGCRMSTGSGVTPGWLAILALQWLSRRRRRHGASLSRNAISRAPASGG